MIEFRNVYKSFGEKKVLNNVSFQSVEGEILFILGKSGVGKSVLLKHLVGLMKPDGGEILLDGQNLTSMPDEEWVEVRKKCGLIFQFPALLDSLSVRENVLLGLSQSHGTMSEDEIGLQVAKYLKLVNLSPEMMERFPGNLSFGVQKRVAIARTLAMGPRYLLFDEPTTGQDPVVTSGFNELLVELSKNLRVTSVVVSHDLKSALKVADRILLLDEGRVVVNSSPQGFRESGVPLAVEFLKGIQHG